MEPKKPFRAKFSGSHCARCNTIIPQGSMILTRPTKIHSRNRFVHAHCPDMSAAESDCIDLGLATPRA